MFNLSNSLSWIILISPGGVDWTDAVCEGEQNTGLVLESGLADIGTGLLYPVSRKNAFKMALKLKYILPNTAYL